MIKNIEYNFTSGEESRNYFRFTTRDNDASAKIIKENFPERILDQGYFKPQEMLKILEEVPRIGKNPIGYRISKLFDSLGKPYWVFDVYCKLRDPIRESVKERRRNHSW